MSRVHFLDPIDYISGKIARKTRVTYCYRDASLSESGEDRRFTQVRGKRKTPYTAAELARFDKFEAVARSTAAVMKNPASLATAQTEFNAQTTYKKLRNYVWHREWENYQG